MRGGTPLHAGAARPALPLAGSENTQDEGFPFHSPTSVLPDGHLAATCHHLHHQAPKSVQRIRKWLKPAPAFLTVPSVASPPPPQINPRRGHRRPTLVSTAWRSVDALRTESACFRHQCGGLCCPGPCLIPPMSDCRLLEGTCYVRT